jgi:hypothetical protein
MPTTLPARANSSSSSLVDVSALRADILNEVQAGLLKALSDALSQVRINVPAPQVSVAAPQVTVDARLPSMPDINIPEASIMLTVPGIADLASNLDKVDRHLATIEALLRAPVTKTVERDANGLIKTVTERRG